MIENASNDFKLQMKELLYILKSEPELNKQLNSKSNFEIKTLIINAYPHYLNKTYDCEATIPYIFESSNLIKKFLFW